MAAALWENLSAAAALPECEPRDDGGGVCWAGGGAGGVAACRGTGVGVADFGTADVDGGSSGVTGDGAGLPDVKTPF